ncbi:MAG: 2OG-Fe(II) oxygenase [Allosphingosinicella sp.]|uniref:2OG-Fe(II) oxygenase n=1 Tax=Allosphingosinicella sp. TaxID=2823234 RepID=UPI00395394A6
MSVTTQEQAPQPLGFGDAAPWFTAPALGGAPAYSFGTAAGRPSLLLFFGSAGHPDSRAALDAVLARRDLFNDVDACFFGVTVDPADERDGRIAQQLPGIRYFLDYDRAVSRRYGAAQEEGRYLPHALVLDAAQRVVARYGIGQAAAALDRLEELAGGGVEGDWAPVLLAPRILEPELCRELIAYYERHGGEESGFMRDVGGKTMLLTDPAHKKRRDREVSDPELRGALGARIRRRLLPMVMRAFQFEATRMERYLIGCYDAERGGHFRPHRDNTTKGTAHRRFAVSINLNAGDFDGGDLRFPEFGPRTYRPPTGGAVVFSCSLLHEATPVTRGTRYAFLPFLYDEAAAKVREENNAHLGDNVTAYRAG